MHDGILQAKLQSLRLVVFDFDGVFTDNTVYVMEDGSEMVRCWRSDGLGLARLKLAGVESIIISTETNPVVGARSRKLAMRCLQGCEDKRAALDALAAELGIALEDVAYVGNDINDAACLEAVGLPIVVGESHPDVLPLAKYRTATLGGRGAVREVCDLIVAARRNATV